MEEELEDLESLYSDHFGRTPNNSQTTEFSGDNSDSDYSDEGECENDEAELVSTRARDFTTANSQSDHDGTDSNSSEEEICETCDDTQTVRQFIIKGCGCRLNCHTKFKFDDILSHILSIREMTKDEKELCIMSLVAEGNDEKTKRGKKRQRSRKTFRVSGKTVCKGTFMLCYDITKYALGAIVKHVSHHGVTPRQHGNAGKKPKHSITYDDVIRVVYFIRNYAEERGLPQPAAPRCLDNIPPVYLTSDTTKKDMHQLYKQSCSDPRVRALELTSFKDIWRTCLPHIRIASPKDDVCATCEKLRRQISGTVTEDVTLETTTALRDHVLLAQKERDLYNECIRRSVDTRDSEEKFVHLTFDFSQNVSLPHFSRQMGPLYFLTLRKIQIFGVRLDGMPHQLNFLIDEDQTIGPDGKGTHGPDAVLSMVDWTLQNHANQTPALSIHSDNCPGQNKNRYTIGYFMWRVMTGQNEKIEYHMQVPGHARCLVDAGFAHLKIKFRRHDVETLQQLADVTEKSSTTNSAVCYPQWSWRQWKPFLERFFKPIIGIRKFQHFRFQSDTPGVVMARKTPEGEEHLIQVLKEPGFRFSSCARPRVITPGGMTSERKRYLSRSVRAFVSQDSQSYYQ
ncbi:uncharacterized protein LOC132753609 isoform X1 [Ruditapes philippinarum]|uniref:uncharacterized protein LOC132753609 isoform X1 n=1 Tax=Ruditapes philippinarum TaxID=129788 RepID=UPI00295B8C14|nr:uncharacterized protein LOC132753609 isoform X1 [Ruditapes philippinarum]